MFKKQKNIKFFGLWCSSLQPAIYVLFMAVFTSAFAQSDKWNWGIEKNPDCPSTYVQPNGLLGCTWFNYSAYWTDGEDGYSGPQRYVMFANWNDSLPMQHGYCYEGTLASIRQYYRWPDRTQMNGFVNGREVYINHTCIMTRSRQLIARQTMFSHARFPDAICPAVDSVMLLMKSTECLRPRVSLAEQKMALTMISAQ